MIEKADLIIFYVNAAWGGAYQALKYAKQKNKNFVNYGKLQI